jgi:hypothetical protein
MDLLQEERKEINEKFDIQSVGPSVVNLLTISRNIFQVYFYSIYIPTFDLYMNFRSLLSTFATVEKFSMHSLNE